MSDYYQKTAAQYDRWHVQDGDRHFVALNYLSHLMKAIGATWVQSDEGMMVSLSKTRDKFGQQRQGRAMARYGRMLTDAQWEKIRPLLPTTVASTWRSTSRPRAQSAGRHFVDIAQRGSLARFAGGISLTFNLLAKVAGLGRARGLAENLAHLSGRAQ